ncbi:MAG TPA: amidohydrolase family protein [Acidimicrobiales bacterium]|nr:amidohydrolase family protein [Acidimicrobiales bacterium]
MRTTPDLFDRFGVIDVDTHLTEPADLWTSRVPSAWHDQVPHIERVDGKDVWMAGGTKLSTPGIVSIAGWPECIPSHPPTFDDIDPAAYDAHARVAFMDEQGIAAQVIYPNVGGFGAQYFRSLGDNNVVVGCVQAYNDFLTDWTSVAPARLVAVTATPFWDLEFSLREIDRCLAMGHRAINFCNRPDAHGMPPLGSRHWDPIWARAQEAGVPISFHIGGGSMTGGLSQIRADEKGFHAAFSSYSSLLILDNQRCLADLIFGCFWFERASALWAIEQYPDNILYETDFPHPTCQHPNAYAPSRYPRDYATDVLSSLSDAHLAKVLHDNAASLYGLA